MATIRRAKPKTHVVIVDTNALWHKDKSSAVSPDFDQAWDEVSALAPLELVIPETVREELWFQQTCSAWKRLDTVTEALSEISGIADRSHTTRIRRDDLRSQVGSKIKRWLKLRRAAIAELPVATINWKQVASDAVWRVAPFTSDPKNLEIEKGFRDALILCTVLDIAAKEQRDVNLAFITGDNLLRRTAQQQLKADQRFSAYEDIADFVSYVKLTKEQLDNAFIKNILSRATEKFYTPEDPSSLYLRDNIAEKIRQQYADFFADPDRSDLSPFKLPTDTTLWGQWMPVDQGRRWLSNPVFVSLEPDRIYHWKSRLTFGRGYRRRPSWSIVPTGPEVWNEHVLFLPFDIYWKAFVKADARFYKVSVEKIELKDNEFRMPNDDDRKALGLAAAAQASVP
jgi:hypothetical protein